MTPPPNHRPRFAMVPANTHGERNSAYDIVDNGRGSEQVLAYHVRLEPAQVIVKALNFYDEVSLQE